eukprot:577076-Ditylum_brightwellii.AAC.1
MKFFFQLFVLVVEHGKVFRSVLDVTYGILLALLEFLKFVVGIQHESSMGSGNGMAEVRFGDKFILEGKASSTQNCRDT